MKVDQNCRDGFLISCQKGIILSWLTIGLTVKPNVMVQYEDKDAIGRRYRRQDAIGTPFCVTIDNQTKEDNTVTVRERDTMAQYRLPIADLTVELLKKLR